MKFLTGLLLITCLSAYNLAFPAATSSQNAVTPSPMPPENNAPVPGGVSCEYRADDEYVRRAGELGHDHRMTGRR